MTKAKSKREPLPVPRNSYALESVYPRATSDWSQLSFERLAFAVRWPIELGGLPRIKHYHNMLKLLYPEYLPDKDDHWAFKQDEDLCEGKWIGWSGAASCAKTCRSALFAVVWWLCAPLKSSVIMTTTTKKALRQRSWAEVLKFYSMLQRPAPGNMVQSQTLWQASKGDDKHAIIGIAVESGPVQKAIDCIKGVHTQRQMVIVDEATSTPDAIFESCTNLFGYPDEFILLVIGNPFSRFDPMGRFCEPKDGWSSISLATDEWESTKKLDGSYGRVSRFDAEKSPNIVAGRMVNKHLISAAKYEQAKRGMGENHPRFWSDYRGFWPPDGLTRTVFTESLLLKMDGFGKHLWAGRGKIMKAGLDPAFGGGDRPILRFGEMGWLHSDKMGLQLTDEVQLSINAASSNPVHFQLAEQVMRECQARNVTPSNFGIDATGEGGGLADIIERLWGRIVRVEFGGRPSELPISEVDRRTGVEVYDRRVTELWHVVRDFLIAGQIKGFTPEDAFEFCNRQFDDSGRKIKLETKDDMKLRMSGRSPDCFVAGTMVLTENGEVPIEDIQIGDSIVTPFGHSRVMALHSDSVSELTELTTSNGRTLTGKGKHKIFTWEDGWVRLDAIALTNTFESDTNVALWQIQNSLFTKAGNTGFKALVDIIKTGGKLHQRDFYTESSGRSIAETFLTACLSITKMVIGPITESPIWSCSPHLNTCGTIWPSASKILNTWQTTRRQFARLLLPQLYGMALSLEGNGTLNTRKTHFTQDGFPSAGVESAGLSSPRRVSISQFSARFVAVIRIIRGVGGAIKEFAWRVARNLWETNTIRRATVPEVVRRFQPTEAVKVFNITLKEDNVYYANGLLVQNCADAIVVLTEVCRRTGMAVAHVSVVAEDSEWVDKVSEYDNVNETIGSFD